MSEEPHKYYSIVQLKAHLSAVLEEASAGYQIIVTDHNKPLAKITALDPVVSVKPAAWKKLLAMKPIPLKKGAISSAELVRQIRDEEEH